MSSYRINIFILMENILANSPGIYVAFIVLEFIMRHNVILRKISRNIQTIFRYLAMEIKGKLINSRIHGF